MTPHQKKFPPSFGPTLMARGSFGAVCLAAARPMVDFEIQGLTRGWLKEIKFTIWFGLQDPTEERAVC